MSVFTLFPNSSATAASERAATSAHHPGPSQGVLGASTIAAGTKPGSRHLWLFPTPDFTFHIFRTERELNSGTDPSRNGLKAELQRALVKLSPQTEAEYRRITVSSKYEGLFEQRLGQVPPRQFYKHRAAYQWALRGEMLAIANQVRAATADKKPVNFDALGSALANKYNALVAISQMRPTGPARTRAGKSARAKLGKLKSGWLENLVANGTATNWMYIAVLALSGMRPAELAKGVEVLAMEDGMVEINMWGAKVTEENGHETRGQIHDPQHSSIARRLHEFAVARGGSMTLFRKVRRIGKDVHAACRRAGMIKIPPYALRHFFASNLKADGVEKLDIAAALGHRSTATQKKYGSKKQGKAGALALVGVSHSDEIRDPERGLPKARVHPSPKSSDASFDWD